MSRGELVRCFVALPLPGEYQRGLERLIGELRRLVNGPVAPAVSWTRPGNWHLTLKFLGEVEAGRLEAVRAALRGLHITPYSLRAGGGGAFPDERRPRVLWTGLTAGAAETAALAAAVEAALEPLGFAPEARAFRPHLTLGRVKDSRGADWGKALEAVRAAPWPELDVAEAVLFRSELSPQGPRYTRLEAFGRE